MLTWNIVTSKLHFSYSIYIFTLCFVSFMYVFFDHNKVFFPLESKCTKNIVVPVFPRFFYLLSVSSVGLHDACYPPQPLETSINIQTDRNQTLSS